jgi:hypothetical protein
VWFSRRAFTLHLALIVWVPTCLLAGWWQVTRAFGGNSLSYLYSAEWPIFAVVGVWGWWMLIHTDPGTVGRRAQQWLESKAPDAGGTGQPVAPPRRRDEEDEELAAYNDQLAELSSRGPRTWRNR